MVQSYRCRRDKDTGLLAGSVVLTTDGEMPVEYLSVGDRLVTRDAGVSLVEHIAYATRDIATFGFAPGCLGRGQPMGTTMLAADQLVLLRGASALAFLKADHALVAASALRGMPGVTALGIRYCTLFQVFCARPHILYCNGIELSTADGAPARGFTLRAA